MKIAIAQLNYTIGAFESNKVKIISSINRAKHECADLVVFAEHSISGTPAYDLLNKVTFLELGEDALIEIAAAADNIAVLVGLPIQRGNRTASAAAFIQNRNIKRYITKQSVTSRDEAAYMCSGDGCEYINVAGHKIAVLVGQDIEGDIQDISYADTIINMAAHRYSRGIIEKRHEYQRKKSYTSGKNLIFVNQLGGHTDIIYDGSSDVFNSKGEMLLTMKSFEEDFAIVDIDAEPHLIEIPYQNRTVNTYNAIKLGIGDFFAKNGYTTACLGLSGGIDSAVVAALAVEVLGRENVRVLLMPSQFSSDHSVEDAVEMAERLGIKYDTVPITETYCSVVKALRPVFGDTPFGVAEENIQARLRCIMLMGLSNKCGHILLNTSNKSELAIGYGTLYGDNTGVLSPIGDLYKSEVFELARYINHSEQIIPENILQKEPSAELRPEQKDSDYLPPYDVVDAILYRMIEEGQHREEIINAGFDAEVVYKIYGMILRNEQKRYQFCPTLRLSTRSFNQDRIMPITSKYGF